MKFICLIVVAIN